jgi:hypothetical protein
MSEGFRRGAVLLLIPLISALACSGSDGPDAPEKTKDKISYELFDSAILLDKSALSQLEPETGDGLLVFKTTPSALANVARASVIVAGQSAATPKGLLRIVRSVEPNGAGVRITTMNAPLQLAFRQLHIELAPRKTPEIGASDWLKNDLTPLSAGSRPFASYTGGKHPTLPLDIVAFDGDKDLSTKDDQVRVKGELGGGFDYTLTVDIDWGGVAAYPSALKACIKAALDVVFGQLPDCSIAALIPEMKASLVMSGELNAKLAFEGAAFKKYEADYSIGDIPLPQIPIGPLVIFPSVEITGRIAGAASSQFALETTADATLSAGVALSSRHGASFKTPTYSQSFTAPTTEVTLAASAKASIGADLHMRLYDFVGPKAGLHAYAELTADQSQSPCWDLHAGVEGRLGFKISAKLPGLGEVTLVKTDDLVIPIVDESIASGACQLPKPGQSSLPPGSGPDNNTLLNPAFTPWSRTYSSPFVSYPFVTADGLRQIQLEQTIDGNYTLASSQSETLFKVNPEGKLLWANHYEMFDDPVLPSMRALRVVDTLDAGLLVLMHPYAVIKIGQGGGVAWGESFDEAPTQFGGPYGDKVTLQMWTGGVADGAGGSWLVATHHVGGESNRTGAWLLHLDKNGIVLSSRRISHPTLHLMPSMLFAWQGGLFIAGFTEEVGGVQRQGFTLALDAAGEVKFANLHGGCGSISDLIPNTGIVHSSGDVILAGNGGQYFRSFVARIKPDGSVGFASFPWSGSGSDYAVISGIAELPTSGFVVTGRYQAYPETSHLFSAGLDSVGGVQWVRDYQLTTAGTQLPESTFPTLRLTDDGGALMAGFSNAGKSSVGDMWLLKAFAKDGGIAFSSGALSASVSLSEAGCTMSVSPFIPSIVPLNLWPTPRDVLVTPVALVTTTQAP